MVTRLTRTAIWRAGKSAPVGHGPQSPPVRARKARQLPDIVIPWRAALALTIPLAVALGVWLLRNQLYFGHPLSGGYDLQVKQD
jgi:hypothetical protein